MRSKTRRLSPSLRLESLEIRSLMSLASEVTAAWNVDPSRSVLVGFTGGLSSQTIASDLAGVGGRLVTYRDDGPSLVALAPWEQVTAATLQLDAEPGVRYVSTNATIHATGEIIPNDRRFPAQWALPFIDAPSAWGVTTGSPATVIAVLDSGIDLRNPDLARKLWNNPDPSGADGFPRDYHGWNFINNSNRIQDNNGHGSHVSGILAAASNNRFGVTGLDWNARLMPVKVLDAQGNGSLDNAISGIYYAVNHGAKVINASWGGVENSQAFLDALNYANSHNVVFVTAAGNDSANNDATPTFPASYRTPNELVVAAVDQSGNLADFSNYGPHTVDVAAPGVAILSTVLRGFAYYTGTSMSTPFVAATAALVAGQFPNMSAADIVTRIRATAKPLPQLSGKLISGGVVDPYFALIGQTSNSGLIPKTDVGSAQPATATSNSPSAKAAEWTIATPHPHHQRVGAHHASVVRNHHARFGHALHATRFSHHVRAIHMDHQPGYHAMTGIQGLAAGFPSKLARWWHR